MVIVNLNKPIECKRCGWRWRPRKKEIRMCPECKSPYFDKKKEANNGSAKLSEMQNIKN